VYEILISSNLTSWTSVSTNTSTNGVFQFIDPIVPGTQQRFYRTLRVGP
jgi:hypothetical protein